VTRRDFRKLPKDSKNTQNSVQISWGEKFIWNIFVRGHCMCKEMLVIPVNRVVDNNRLIGKNGGGGDAQGVATSLPPPKKRSSGI
jgi:hypothetical protein